MPPAARVGDMHECTSMTGTVPHDGGPLIGPGAPTVLIGQMPAACVGDSAVCVGPPDSLTQGSETVLVEGKPLVRMGDPTEHGGEVVMGCPTVIVG